MADESGGEPRRESGCGIGAQLREARERAGLSIAQAAQRLHVVSETLEALEAERFDALGATIYVKAYLGRYAELLGISPEALTERLTDAVLPVPDLTSIPHVKVRSNHFISAVVIVVGVLIVAGLSWWVWARRHEIQAVAMSLRRSATPLPAARAPVPHAVPSPVGAPSPVAASTGPTPSPAIVPGSVRITLEFPASSWVAVNDATGRSLYHGTVAAGTTKSFRGRAPLHVVVGYASGVTLTVDGRPAPIDSYAGRDHAVSIAVAADGRLSAVPWHAGG